MSDSRIAELQLLGGVELSAGDSPVPIGGPIPRAILTLLWLWRDRTIATDRLIEELWGDRPPAQARNSLQSYVSNLRRSLTPEVGHLVLPRRSSGYTLVGELVGCDQQEFEARAQAGVEANRTGRHTQALDACEAALAAWSGDPYLGARDTSVIEGERRRLDGLRSDVVMHRIDALLGLGQGDAVVTELETLVGEHSWNERPWRQLMTALYQAGRHADAVTCANRARRALGEEKGLAPSPELLELERQVLDHDRCLLPNTTQPTSQTPPDQAADRAAVARRSQASTACRASSAMGAGARPSPPVPFVGRRRELSELEAAWERARTTGPQLVVVEGEPGIGKTSLAASFLRSLHDGGADVMYGRCDQHLPSSYQPLDQLFACRPAAEIEPLLAGWNRVLCRLLPEQIGDDQPWSASAMTLDDRYLMAEAIKSWLLGLASRRPAVVVLDDVQWAMDPLLDVVRHVVATGGTAPLLIVALTRRAGRLGRDQTCTSIELAGLTEDDLVALAGDYELGRLLQARSGGNAFFATEVLRTRHDGVPETVRALVAESVAKLSPPASTAMVELASVGDRCEHRVLVAATSLGPAELTEALDELMKAGLVREHVAGLAAYELAHTIVGDAVYDSMSMTRRIAVHRRVACALDDIGGEPTVIARHWAEAARGGELPDLRAAIGAARQAATVADRRSDHPLAAALLEERLALASHLPAAERRSFQLDAADAAKRAGRSVRDRYIDIGHEAAAAGHLDALCRAALGPGRGFFSQTGSPDVDQIGLLREALRTGPAQPSPTRARLLAALAAELTWADDGDQRFALADEALRLARACGCRPTLNAVLAQRLLTISCVATIDGRLEDAAELAQLASSCGDPLLEFEAAFQEGGAVLPLGDIERAGTCLDRARHLSEELHQPMLTWLVRASTASHLLARGDLQHAESEAAAAGELGQLADRTIEASILHNSQLMEIRRAQGRLIELAPLLRAAGSSPRYAFVGPRMLCELGEPELAQEVVSSFDPRMVRADMVELLTLANYAALVVALGAPREAAVAYEVLRPHAERFPHGMTMAPVVHHWLGLLAATMEMDPTEHLSQAIDRHRRAGLPLLLIESLTAMAALAPGGRPEARQEAQELAAAHAAPGLLAIPVRCP